MQASDESRSSLFKLSSRCKFGFALSQRWKASELVWGESQTPNQLQEARGLVHVIIMTISKSFNTSWIAFGESQSLLLYEVDIANLKHCKVSEDLFEDDLTRRSEV